MSENTPVATPDKFNQGMTVCELMDQLNKQPGEAHRIEACKLKIVVFQPGSLGGVPTVAVQQAFFGIDWNANQLMLYPTRPLTTLTPEDLAAVHKSAKEGQSWHAYQAYKQKADELTKLRGVIKALLPAAESAGWQSDELEQAIKDAKGCL
jgi:hypothetical protein